MTTGKTIALTRRTFVGKVISLLLNMLSRLLITFLPRSKRLLISWLQSPSAVILEHPTPATGNHCFTFCLCKFDYSKYLILGGSKITADGDCSHEMKRRLPLGRKVMTNLDSILKIRDITLPTKICRVKAMVFPVVIYGCENWTIKKAECP